MATVATSHFASNGSLNAASKIDKYTPHRLADDDDSIRTEQFPEFDPSHDGSEDEVSASGGHYTHTATDAGRTSARGNGFAIHGQGYGNGFASNEEERRDAQSIDDDDHDDDEDGEEEEERSLSPIEPLPEPDHHDDETVQQEPVRSITSPVTSPPYWRHSYANGNSTSLSLHDDRNIHNLSTESLVPGAITLQDNEADSDSETAGGSSSVLSPTSQGGHHRSGRDSEETRTSYGRDRNKACWAKSVEVTDYVIVNGSATNIGAFVVWNIRVQTLSGPYMNIRKRYSEFDDFRHALIETFPGFEAAVPVLPPKSVISRFRPRFLEKRRAGLQYFLK